MSATEADIPALSHINPFGSRMASTDSFNLLGSLSIRSWSDLRFSAVLLVAMNPIVSNLLLFVLMVLIDSFNLLGSLSVKLWSYLHFFVVPLAAMNPIVSDLLLFVNLSFAFFLPLTICHRVS